MKVAIVTGGASGIGRALSEALARRGVDVVVADRQADLAAQVADAIVRTGGRATAAELDVRSFEAFERVVQDTRRRAGRIDYLFNNAGIAVGGEMTSYSLADWHDVLDVNLRGVCHGIHAVYPVMREQGSGHVINTASMAGICPSPLGSYSAAKHGVVGVSRALRIEGRLYGVKCSVLCPGAIRTPIFTGGRYGRINVPVSNEKILELWERMRPMDPDELARRTLDDVDRDRAVIIHPRWWRLLWYMERLAPSLSSRVWERLLAELRKETSSITAPVPPPESRPVTQA
jgi:NAD(P)-dependent dehydrogenase (short-subunit alcohol dehydrogenase family)